MQRMNFSVQINSPKKKVWKTLWDDKTFRDWADNVDEGMYLKGELKEGNVVHFMSPNGMGVKSLVEKLTPNEFISFRHTMDTKDGGEREEEWSGGVESYALVEKDGVTLLTTELDVPPGQEETFKERLPKALDRIKVLAENS